MSEFIKHVASKSEENCKHRDRNISSTQMLQYPAETTRVPHLRKQSKLTSSTNPVLGQLAEIDWGDLLNRYPGEAGQCLRG